MENFLTFITDNSLLISAWLVVLAMIIYYEKRAGATGITPSELTHILNKENGVIIDIRKKQEWDEGHITNAIHIPAEDLEKRLDELGKYKEQPIVVVCNIGHTAGGYAKKLIKAGFGRVSRLTGGMNEWRSQNLPLVK